MPRKSKDRRTPPKSPFTPGKYRKNLTTLAKALESGALKHGRGYLDYERAQCCLGVTCILAGFPRTISGGHASFVQPNDDAIGGYMGDEIITDHRWWRAHFSGVTVDTLAETNDESDDGYAPVIKRLRAAAKRAKS